MTRLAEALLPRMPHSNAIDTMLAARMSFKFLLCTGSWGG